MSSLKKHLGELRKAKRARYHPLKARITTEHRISRKALFYIKEYGPHTNVPKTIIKESLKILLFASLLSSFGGLALEHIRSIFISVVPLVVLLPALNDMLGDYGIIISSRFTNLLYTGEIKGKLLSNVALRKLFLQVIIISLITAIISAAAALAVPYFSNYHLTFDVVYKVFLIGIIDTLLIVIFLFFISLIGGMYIYKKNEDPDNFLIPITTSVADFGNMVILAFLVILFF